MSTKISDLLAVALSLDAGVIKSFARSHAASVLPLCSPPATMPLQKTLTKGLSPQRPRVPGHGNTGTFLSVASAGKSRLRRYRVSTKKDSVPGQRSRRVRNTNSRRTHTGTEHRIDKPIANIAKNHDGHRCYPQNFTCLRCRRTLHNTRKVKKDTFVCQLCILKRNRLSKKL